MALGRPPAATAPKSSRARRSSPRCLAAAISGSSIVASRAAGPPSFSCAKISKACSWRPAATHAKHRHHRAALAALLVAFALLRNGRARAPRRRAAETAAVAEAVEGDVDVAALRVEVRQCIEERAVGAQPTAHRRFGRLERRAGVAAARGAVQQRAQHVRVGADAVSLRLFNHIQGAVNR